MENKEYLYELSQIYRNKIKAKSKIIELRSILNLPKTTEHFISDIHGEFDSFSHVIKNGSGVIRGYIDEVFSSNLSVEEKDELATLIYYTEEKLIQKQTELSKKEYKIWSQLKILNLIDITRRVTSKYTHRKIRRSYDPNLYTILDELLLEDFSNLHKGKYYRTIITNIVDMGMANDYILALTHLIKRFSVETLHIIGDIYDRGRDAYKVMEFLTHHHDADIQWGNHDIAWLGAYHGSAALIANVIRVAARYNNLSSIETDYDIDLNPLKEFALKTYDFSPNFLPKVSADLDMTMMLTKLHKAISIIQLKAEGQVIMRNPEFQLEHMNLLHKINWHDETVELNNEHFPVHDLDLPTVTKGREYEFTKEESEVVNLLVTSFKESKKLKNHMDFLLEKGGIYKICNNNLLFHGCMPFDKDGNLKETRFLGEPLKGRELFEKLDNVVKNGLNKNEPEQYILDILFYLWAGPDSPLFGKTRNSNFVKLFIPKGPVHREWLNPYFTYREDENIIDSILAEFNLDSKNSKIVNGHTPVKTPKGESPVKAGGKLIVIDGGFAQAFQKITGTAGYTLISNSRGILLAAHNPLASHKDLIEDNLDITSGQIVVDYFSKRCRMDSTDKGRQLKKEISQLVELVEAYDSGLIEERY